MAIEIQSYSPKRELKNAEIEEWGVIVRGKPLTAQAIKDKVGVERRFIAGEGESVLDMAVKAVGGLKSPALSPDMVFFSTSYPDGVNNAGELIKHFNFPVDGFKNIHAACSGFAVAFSDVYQKRARYAKDTRFLIVSSEDYAPYLVDLRSGMVDASLSQTIFSAGATSFAFQEGKDIEILNAVNYTFPLERSQGLRMPIRYDLVRYPALTIDIPLSDTGYFWMDGGAVYKAVNSTLPGVIKAAVKDAKLEPAQIRLIIPHQASKPMLDGLSERLPQFDLYPDLKDGNLSSASIPKAMARALEEGAITRGDKVVLAGFGAGLFASVVVIQLN